MADHARRHRRNYNDPRHAHELTISCYRRYPSLKSEQTCMWLKDAIDAARAEFDVALWAFVFMPEHIHVLLWPRQPLYDIAAIRRVIKEPVGRQAVNYVSRHALDWLPRLTRSRGKKTEHLFWQGGGGFDRNIWTTRALLAAIEYIHLNPVRRGLVTHAVDWKWSSAAWYELQRETPLAIDPISPAWLNEVGQQ